MLTAILAGIIISSIAIFIYSAHSRAFQYSINPTDSLDNYYYQNDIDEEDPTYSSRITNTVIFSSDPNLEISEKNNNGPTLSNKKVSAKSYIVRNISDNKTILEKDNDKVMPIASITKLVTAVVARRLLDQDQYIVITPEVMKAYGNEARFRIGEKMTMNELLYPLLLVSSNDAADALAMSYSKGKRKFVEEMNNWVNDIGAYKTHFSDPSGLSAYNVSTVSDMAKITDWILKNDPEIFNITAMKYKSLRTHTWTNPTHLLNITAYIGGKNGYTPEANRTGLSIFEIGKKKKIFAVILLGSSMRDNDTLDLLDDAVM